MAAEVGRSREPRRPHRLELRSVTVRYGDGTVGIGDVDLTAESGRCIVVVGPSGAGKSTVLRVAGGQVRPTGGQVCLDGEDLGATGRAGRLRWRRDVTLVAQEQPMLERRTVRENVSYAAEVARPGANSDAEVGALLARLGLDEVADRPPKAISGGERQRAALAQGLARRTPVLLVDEPTSHLDPALTALVAKIIGERCADSTACVVATHEEEAFLRIADLVLQVEAGRARRRDR